MGSSAKGSSPQVPASIPTHALVLYVSVSSVFEVVQSKLHGQCHNANQIEVNG